MRTDVETHIHGGGPHLFAELEKEFARVKTLINTNAGSAELSDTFAEFPDASTSEGRFRYDRSLGRMYWSDGTTWHRVPLEETELSSVFTRSANFSFTAGPTWVTVPFDNTVIDELGDYNTGTGIFTVTAQTERLEVAGNVELEWGGNVETSFGVRLVVAGIALAPSMGLTVPQQSGYTALNIALPQISVDPGDTLGLQVYVDGGTSPLVVQSAYSWIAFRSYSD